MKHHLLLLLSLVLVLPATALAQSDGEPEAPQEGETEEPAEPAAPAEGAAEEEEQQEEAEESEEAQLSEPEPEVSAGGPAATGGDLAAPDVSSDVLEAREEVALTEQTGDEEAVDEALEEERLPWRNSLFLYDNEISTTTLDGGSSTLTYNPYWSMAFSFRPRWYFTEDISARLRQDLSIELTDTDTLVKNRRPVLADTILEVVHGNLYELEGIVLSGGPRITLPTSIASRAYEKYFTLSLGAALSRPFEDVLEGAELGVSVRYGYTFAGSNVRTTDDPIPQARAVSTPLAPGDAPESQASGVTSIDHELVWALSGSISPIENVQVATSFTWWYTNGRAASPGCVEVLTDADGCLDVPDDSDTHLRLSTWFTLGASYQWLDWLNTELTYSHLTSEFAPNGARRNPFWSVDSTLALTATFTLDELYQDFSGTGTSPAEVVEEQETRDDGSARAAAQAQAVAW